MSSLQEVKYVTYEVFLKQVLHEGYHKLLIFAMYSHDELKMIHSTLKGLSFQILTCFITLELRNSMTPE